MKKTGVVLGALVAGAVALEGYALSNPGDDVVTISDFIRAFPCWATVAMFSFIGALSGHLWWK